MELKERVFRALASKKYAGVNADEVILALTKYLKANRSQIIDALDDLCTEHRLDLLDDDTIEIKDYTGTYQGNKNGGKYILTLDGKKLDVEESKLYHLLHGDKVKYSTYTVENKPCAVVNELVGRANASVIGQVAKVTNPSNPADYELVFIPHDRRFGTKLPLRQTARANSLVGHKCSISLHYSDDHTTFEGVIDKDFGPAGDPITENTVIAHAHKFKKEFNKLAMIESMCIPTEVKEEEILGRLDLRDKKFVTIDPENCKDMDDAVCCEKTENGYTLYVAIADVSHYVAQGSEIDKEAYIRGTSAYLGDGVYPMLPPVLSEGICSLNPNVDRLSLVYTINLDNDGNIIDYSIDKGVINSKYKLSYKTAQNIHEEKEYEHIKKSDIKHSIDLMYEVTEKLKAKRQENYPLDIDSHEPTFRFNETKTDVIRVEDTSDQTAKSVIEESMLLANFVSGDFTKKHNLPTLYRVHEEPDPLRIENYQMVLDDLGVNYIVSTDNTTLSDLSTKLQTHPLGKYLTSRLLRVFPKAHYSPNDIGHFGLNMEHYIHSTSPIRRYPDLVQHRVISDYLENPNHIRYSGDTLKDMGEYLSEREKEADHASRESADLLQTLWATKYLGQVVEGTVYDITSDGIVLTIKNEQNLDMITVTV
ncbi:MAG: VacB/RNase II family 3'-5' exoribonuclease, partial [Clostridia bacterium]|nr:VacB/RNase II family 3'-5' exoribonuclease [Clostridia bacterium]